MPRDARRKKPELSVVHMPLCTAYAVPRSDLLSPSRNGKQLIKDFKDFKILKNLRVKISKLQNIFMHIVKYRLCCHR